MEDNSLVLKGLTGSVILISATLVAVPTGAADSETYGITGDDLNEHDYASTLLAEENENQIGAIPQAKVKLKTREELEDLDVLDLQKEETEELQVTEEFDIGDYTVTLTDSDGEEAVYLTVREQGEIVHDQAYEETEKLDYDSLDVQVEEVEPGQETAKVTATVKDGYVIHGGPSVNELAEKLEQVNPRLDASGLKNEEYNALIITGENTEEAVKNIASLQKGIEKSQIDIDTS